MDRVFPKFLKLIAGLTDASATELVREKVGKLSEKYRTLNG
jgi:hypothetical protein